MTKQIEEHLKDKREELVWALSIQGYTNIQIAKIFNLGRMAIKRIVDRKPKDWIPKWVKR